MTRESYRSGFVAVLGRPNVGKSTLVNALVGEKISIVSSKPQTTRHAILGILTEADYQAVFIDTPGLHSGSGRLMNRVMNRAAAGSIASADVVLLVVEADRWFEADEAVLDRIREARLPCLLIVNKVDRIRPREKLLPFLEEAAARFDFVEIVPVSALKGSNLERLKTLIAGYLNQQEALYPEDIATDRGGYFRAAEIIREKLMQMLHEEVPYGVSVEVNELTKEDERLHVDATVWVEREAHKAIVLGKGGQRIKSIGRAARLDLQVLFESPVFLRTHVKLKRNWSDSVQALRQLGYGQEPEPGS